MNRPNRPTKEESAKIGKLAKELRKELKKLDDKYAGTGSLELFVELPLNAHKELHKLQIDIDWWMINSRQGK